MSEPWHRRWLHALEADLTVPGTAMQIGRIYADYASSKGGRWADPSYVELVRQTHRTRDAIADAIEFLVTREWLHLRGTWQPGQAKSYDLIIPGQRRNRSAQPTSRPSRTPGREQSAQPAGSVRESRPVPSGPAGQPAQPATTVRESRPDPAGSADYIRPRRFSSLSVRGLHQALAAEVPDVTERETIEVRDMIGRRPGVVSAAAVMRTEISAGNGPKLVAQVRGTAAAAARQTAARHHEFERGPSGWCKWCDQDEQAATHRALRVPTD